MFVRGVLRVMVWWVLGGITVASAASADESLVASVLEDTKLYFTAPLRWDGEDWLAFGGTLVLIGASHEFDERVRTHFATGANAVLNGQDKNSVRDALPAAALIAGTGLAAAFLSGYGWVSGNPGASRSRGLQFRHGGDLGLCGGP